MRDEATSRTLVIDENLFDVHRDALMPHKRRRNHNDLAVIELVTAAVVRPLLQFGEGDARIHGLHEPHSTSSMRSACRCAPAGFPSNLNDRHAARCRYRNRRGASTWQNLQIATMTLQPGTRFGAYESQAPLGAGGMGEGYRARDTRLQRDVAIKVLPELFASDPERLARFEREAHLLAALNHPHIAQVYGLERQDRRDGQEGPKGRGAPFIVMEFVDGPTLADRLVHGRIPLDEALPIARQIADALEAAHEQGIIHRDLKPANIKIRDDGTVKVLDFGLAKAMEGAGQAGVFEASMSPTMISPAQMTHVGIILGTAAYMSPEQAKGRVVDKRADVWAFGCVLFEMLTGKPTFTGESVTETLASVMRDAPSFDALPPGTPPHVGRLLRRCLERDPRQRLRDMGEARIAF